jgi:hypothetical protein
MTVDRCRLKQSLMAYAVEQKLRELHTNQIRTKDGQLLGTNM